MWRSAVLCLALAGCDALFRIDRFPDAASRCGGMPRQETSAGEASSGMLHGTVIPTEPGSTLVVVAAIASPTYNIAALADDGGNTWHQAVTIASPVANAPAGLDIWYAEDASSITSFDAMLENGAMRSMIVSFTEWQCSTAMVYDTAASMPGPPAASVDATAGRVETTTDDLVIGAIVFDDAAGIVSPPSPMEFTSLRPFSTAQQTGARAAYAWVPAGAHQIDWTLGAPLDWVGGTLALKVR